MAPLMSWVSRDAREWGTRPKAAAAADLANLCQLRQSSAIMLAASSDTRKPNEDLRSIRA